MPRRGRIEDRSEDSLDDVALDTAVPRRAPPRGRGAAGNPDSRFASRVYQPDPDAFEPEDDVDRRTRFLRDSTRSVISRNSSPDIPFDVSLNPYRGCEHGCAYCYARPTHEYLGFSPGLDFERMIMVKEDAPKLLERELRKPSWQPKTMLLSGVTDPYQPIERRLKLTRSCLEVLRDFRHPVSVITKNHLVTRDIDILAELAEYDASHVTLSITTLNEELRRKLEPRTSTGPRRVDAVRELSAAGIPVSVNIAPVIPGLNDQEIPAILEAAAEAGATTAHFILVRLPGAVEPIFLGWLEAHYPERKEKVLGRLREARGGKLNESSFGKRMTGEGPYAESIRAMFHVSRKRNGLSERSFLLSCEHFQAPGSSSQPGLFGGQ
ncbi:MAG: PA0069 family radical SAM protein [Trueperaceae bacterium]